MSDPIAELEARLAQADVLRDQVTLRLDLCVVLEQRDAQRALALAREATDLAAALDDAELLGRAWMEQGAVLFHLGELAPALQAYVEAEGWCRQAGAEARRADALRGMGIVYERLDDFQRALEHLTAALHLYQAHGNRQAQARTLNSLGVVLSRSGQPEEGLAMYEQAYTLHRELGQTFDMAVSRNNMGINLKNLGRYAEAEIALEEACRLLADTIHYASPLSNLALVYEGQGRLREAEAAQRQAYALAQRAGLTYILNEVSLCLGRFYLAQGQTAQAQPLLEAALTHAREAELPAKAAEAHQALARLHRQTGDLSAALEHLERALEFERQVFNEQADRRFKNLQISFQVEQLRRQAEHERRERETLHAAYAELERLHRVLEETLQQKEVLLKRLEQLSQEDALTGLYNRRYLDQRLAEEFARAQRYRHPLSVALADIDNFKQINDRLSHAVGDQTLRQVAQLLRQTLRATDVIARYGGEEFAMVFLETDLEDARRICEKVRAAVEGYAWHTIHPELRVTLSIGVSDDLSLVNHEKLLSAADHWLYQAKYGGKNRVCWPPTPWQGGRLSLSG
ncbi:diguanylate cyclase [Kallotenue papyrolyticum]|uniref:diguanylate cyclase n=1 Tax=Kallotenue papyrolyticum TaxID=1325125 RepID=UPI00046EB39D|nr:diguanylate cyclase [Kallotenue papyrolyticum]